MKVVKGAQLLCLMFSIQLAFEEFQKEFWRLSRLLQAGKEVGDPVVVTRAKCLIANFELMETLLQRYNQCPPEMKTSG